MKKNISLALAALGVTAVIAAPTGALAAEAATLDTTTSAGITWVDATVPAGDHAKVTIKIINVSERSSSVWQRCTFNFTGTGNYRCGIDSGAGSLAHEQGGRWIAKAFVDGEQIARKAFSF